MVNTSSIDTAERAIYRAAVEPSEWEAAARAVQAIVGGHSVNLAITDLRQTDATRLVSTGFRDGDGAFYEQNILAYDDQLPLLRHFAEAGVGASNLIPNGPSMETLWSYQAFYREIGYCQYGVILIDESPTHRSWLTVARAENDPVFDRSDVDTLFRLRHHLVNAHEINRALAQSRVPALVHESLIERVRVPFVLIDRGLRVRACNSAALATESKARIRLTNGHLHFEDPKVRRQVGTFLSRARSKENQGVSFELPTGGLVALCPLEPGSPALGTDTLEPHWAVFLMEKTRGFDVPEHLLRSAFDMTPAEIKVVQSLCRGQDTREIARRLPLSPHTLRNHLKSVYRKTDTTTQAQLVAMLAATFPLAAL